MNIITLPNGITIESTNVTPQENILSEETLDLLNEYSVESILEAFIACECLYSTEAKKIFDNAKNYQTALKQLASTKDTFNQDVGDLMDTISKNRIEYLNKGGKNINVKKYKNEADKLKHEKLLNWRKSHRFDKEIMAGKDKLRYAPSNKRYEFKIFDKKINKAEKIFNELNESFNSGSAKSKVQEDINRAKEAGSRASSATANAAKAATGGATNKAGLLNKFKNLSNGKKAGIIAGGLAATGALAYGGYKGINAIKNRKQTAAESILAMYEEE